MRYARSVFKCLILFVCVEALMVTFIDKPLSFYVRSFEAQTPWLIDIFRSYTNYGKAKWYLIPSGLLILAFAAIIQFMQLPDPIRQKLRHYSARLSFFFACIAVSGIITDILKPIIGRARPVLLEHEGLYGAHPFTFDAVWNSMPSGHSTTAFAFVFAMTLLIPRGWIIWWSVGILLALSRIMVSAHYLSDVMAGSAVAYGSVYCLEKFFRSKKVIQFFKNSFPLG